jgi:hypothetical protein
MNPAGQRLQRHRVVEVARRLRVNGHERYFTQIRAIAPVGVLHLARDLGRGVRHLSREFVRNIAAGQDLLHLGERILGLAQHLEQGDLQRGARLGRISRDLGHHGQARTWRRAAAAQNHWLGDPGIIGLEA